LKEIGYKIETEIEKAKRRLPRDSTTTGRYSFAMLDSGLTSLSGYGLRLEEMGAGHRPKDSCGVETANNYKVGNEEIKS
jgi:hypothetical protein